MIYVQSTRKKLDLSYQKEPVTTRIIALQKYICKRFFRKVLY